MTNPRRALIFGEVHQEHFSTAIDAGAAAEASIAVGSALAKDDLGSSTALGCQRVAAL